MDLARFVSLISRQSLFLARVGLLASNDPYEGRVSSGQATITQAPWSEDMIAGVAAMGGQPMTAQLGRTIMTAMLQSTEMVAQDYTFVNCWHMNTTESDAMWRLYSLQGQGIAIRSTFDRLERSLHMEPRQLFLGVVEYADYGNHFIDTNNGFNLVMSKRSSFSHENELRIAHTDSQLLQKRQVVPGIYAVADLDILVEEIVVSPASPAWVAEVVTSIVRRYSMSPSLVRQSPLYSPRT